jgi:hypothetical protein
LATTLPSIEDDPDKDESSGQTNTNVSLTGSFSAIAATGAATSVGDELLADVDPDDIFIDDADDSIFDEEFTETGAFAGKGYVDMPQSRLGRFFNRFRRKDKKEEESAHDWLGVDDDFDARKVGKERGGWESFREDDDEWLGGAFDGIRDRLSGGGEDRTVGGQDRHVRKSIASPFEGLPLHMDETADQVYAFAGADQVTTEVWFVALGSQGSDQAGIKAFMAEHADDMRGAIVVNLEALGDGDTCYLESEGEIFQRPAASRVKRFVRQAAQRTGVNVHSAKIDWRESAASYALKHNLPAITLVGMDGDKPAGLGEAGDTLEGVNPQKLEESANFVIEVLKNV